MTQETVLLKDVPKGEMFVFVDFKSTVNEICEHYGLVHNGFDSEGESKYAYDVIHVANLVDGVIKRFDERDFKYRSISSRGGDMNCMFVP